MKGLIVEELIYFIIIIIAVFFLAVYFIFQQGTRGVEVRKNVEERGFIESGNSLIFSTFNYKLPFVEKVALEFAIDSILQGVHFRNGEKMNQVFYGKGIATVNNTEIFYPMFDNFVKNRWRLEVNTPDGQFVYGNNRQDKIIYSFVASIPVPHERVGKLVLTIT